MFNLIVLSIQTFERVASVMKAGERAMMRMPVANIFQAVDDWLLVDGLDIECSLGIHEQNSTRLLFNTSISMRRAHSMTGR